MLRPGGPRTAGRLRPPHARSADGSAAASHDLQAVFGPSQRLLAWANGGSHAYYHADGNGNITCLIDTMVSPAGTFGYTYKGAGSLVTNLALPTGGAITNDFDSAGRWLGTWLKNSGGTVQNSHTYVDSAASQRTNDTAVTTCPVTGSGTPKVERGLVERRRSRGAQ